MSKRQFYAEVSSGELVSVRYGVFASRAALKSAGNDSEHRHALEVAAARVSRSGAGTASHHSAAVIRGLRMLRQPDEGTVTLTVPPGGTERQLPIAGRDNLPCRRPAG